MGSNTKNAVADALASAEEKLAAESGYGADLTDEFRAIRVAVGLEKAAEDDGD